MAKLKTATKALRTATKAIAAGTLCEHGYTRREIAVALEVSEATVCRYLQAVPPRSPAQIGLDALRALSRVGVPDCRESAQPLTAQRAQRGGDPWSLEAL